MIAEFDSIYENDREANQHRMTMEKISSTTGKSFQEIQSIYENTLRDFKKEAHFKDYLLILVSRKVESLIRS